MTTDVTQATTEDTCLYRRLSGDCDAHNPHNWIPLRDLRYLVHTALPRQLAYEENRIRETEARQCDDWLQEQRDASLRCSRRKIESVTKTLHELTEILRQLEPEAPQ